MLICDYCKKLPANENISIIVVNQKKKCFCSNVCCEKFISKYHVGIPRPKHVRDAIAKSNSKPLTEERKKKISESHLAKHALSDEIKEIIVNMLYKPYYSYKIIAKEVNIDWGKVKKFAKTLNIPEIIEANKIRPQGYHKQNGFFVKATLDWFAENVDKFTIAEIISKYGYCPYKPWLLKYFGKSSKHAKIIFHAGKTNPEKIVEQFLIDNNVDYEYNKMIKVKTIKEDWIWYSVDFVIGNDEIFIEVQGDYWHANPKIYNYSELSGMQRSNINRDKRKKAQIIANYNKNYFQIWEYDIKNNTNEFLNVKKEILCLLQNKNAA